MTVIGENWLPYEGNGVICLPLIYLSKPEFLNKAGRGNLKSRLPRT